MSFKAPEEDKKEPSGRTMNTESMPLALAPTLSGSAPLASQAGEAARDPWIGRILAGVYRIEEKIGEGGMGAVYRATHVHIDKAVAIKVLNKEIASNREAVERLRQEAVAASAIEHDNIVNVFGFDWAEDGSVFIVMELLRGESLASRLEKKEGKGLGIQEAVKIALEICDALGSAHERGIVHRDLKPENIFLAQKGEQERVKILDFGISKIKGKSAEELRMTRTGQLIGTPLYMSPEQARGETDFDHRVDIYAMGVILFEMLTGSPPFKGRNYFELLWKHGNEAPPSMRECRPDLEIPDALEAVVRKALAKRKEERFGSMREMAQAIREAVAFPNEGKASFSENRKQRAGKGMGVAVTGLGVALLLIVGLLLVFGRRDHGGLSGGEVLKQESATAASQSSLEPPTTSSQGSQENQLPKNHEEGSGSLAPPEVLVHLESQPMGARVYSSAGKLLCTTPCDIGFPPKVRLSLTFRKEGHFDATEEVEAAEGVRVLARLRPKREDEKRAAKLPIKTSL
ncbi:MAG: serine/threonine protein kinase [Sandaracinaceae bacterium]|nr:serine/threonine protein kinase [Sandaracinaceae bacterium]